VDDEADQNVFIWLLEQGEKAGLEGLSVDEVLSQAQEAGFVGVDAEGAIQLGDLDRLRFLYYEAFYKPPGFTGSRSKFSLKLEYYARLIDYRELKLARKQATSARRWAAAALIVSAVALLVGAGQLFVAWRAVYPGAVFGDESESDRRCTYSVDEEDEGGPRPGGSTIRS